MEQFSSTTPRIADFPLLFVNFLSSAQVWELAADIVSYFVFNKILGVARPLSQGHVPINQISRASYRMLGLVGLAPRRNVAKVGTSD